MNASLRITFAVLTCTLLVYAIVASGLHLVDAAHDARGLFRQLGEVQREQDALLAQHSRLLLERGALSSLQNIERVAEQELGMQFPDTVAQVLK